MVARPHPYFSIMQQCQLLKVPRSTFYYDKRPASADDLALMRRIDELYLKWPFYGSRRMVAQLRGEGYEVNRKRVRRLMRLMGIEAIYQKPNTSRKHPSHKIYPYLLKNLTSTVPIKSGAQTSPTFPWHTDGFTWSLSWIGTAGACWHGACRSRWRRTFALR